VTGGSPGARLDEIRRRQPVDLPPGATTRFAPAPTGRLHLGHVANALFTWGLAEAAGGSVVLRIEDHDRQRSRREFEADLLEDLAWLGFRPDRPGLEELAGDGPSPYRQSDSAAVYEASLARLRDVAHVYRCDCTRATFARFAGDAGRPWAGPGCPGGCAGRRVPTGETALRMALGDGEESWRDLLLGTRSAAVAASGDLVVRDRRGNWTYSFAVVVDDIRHGIGLVVRGADLVDDTARQVRLGRLLGRSDPPIFAHHPLLLRPDGTKLSKSAGDTAVAELRAGGLAAAEVIGRAAAAVGLVEPGKSVPATAAACVVAGRDGPRPGPQRNIPRSATIRTR
jgi:glutamyl/glutaminyl-tRNA synthetase